ncbi:MAG TPA: putative quinol monooxygenase [Ignavibacteriaceae bacterium]|nr:putative quinol monooxygenase [Ignavibacteriaceae bacterium]
MGKNKNDLIVIASAKAKPGLEAELEKLLVEVAEPTRRQPGCVSFSVYRSADDNSVIIGFERWASKNYHEKHLQGSHVQTLMSKMGNILSGPPVIQSFVIKDEI